MKKMDSKRKNKRLQKRSRQEKTKSEIENKQDNLRPEWNDSDKKMLLEGLEKYGPENIEAISEFLPKIPLEAIESKILEYKMAAGCLQQRELLDEWLNSGSFSPEDSVVPEALLFIQLFENHPSPAEADGCDFKAIYDFLYRSCFEQLSIEDLPEKSRDVLCTALSKVETNVWPKCERDIWEYIGRVYPKRMIKKVYPGKNIYSL